MSKKPFHANLPRNLSPKLKRGDDSNTFNQGRRGHSLLSNYNPVVIGPSAAPLKKLFIPVNKTMRASFGAGDFEWDLTLFVSCTPTKADLAKQVSLVGSLAGHTFTSTQTDVIDLLDADGNVLKTISISGSYSNTIGDNPSPPYSATSTMGTVVKDTNGTITSFHSARYTPGYDDAVYHNDNAVLWFLDAPYTALLIGEVPP